MKTSIRPRPLRGGTTLVVTAVLALPLFISTSRGMTPAARSPDPTAANSDTTSVRVMRATDFIGTDVISSDGRKVGDIADFIFDPKAPRLDYVIVMTGGFLDVGGRNRAVPAEALTLNGDTAHVGITRQQFFAIPRLPANKEHYLADPQNEAMLERDFQLTNVRKQPQTDLIAYSTLARANAYSKANGQLGYIDDVWISLNQDRAPFVEITPTMNPFQLPGPNRYAIPMALMNPTPANGRDFDFAVTDNDLYHAQSVTDTPGVQMANSGFVGNQVLRVTLADAGAGQPTGRSSAESASAGSAAAASAAQSVRQAFDQDPSLRQANVQVRAQQGQVVLSGTVPDDSLRRHAEQCAEPAANGVPIQNQLKVRNP